MLYIFIHFTLRQGAGHKWRCPMKRHYSFLMLTLTAMCTLIILGCGEEKDPRQNMRLYHMEERGPRLVAEAATVEEQAGESGTESSGGSSGSTGSKTDTEVLGPEHFYFQRDIVFAETEESELRLSLALPAQGNGPFPVILFFPVSVWKLPARNFFEMDMMNAACRGYAAASFECRQCVMDESGVNRHGFPAQLYDAKAAVRWIRANAERYGFDAGHIGAVGYSTGAHLALLTAFTNGIKEYEGSLGDTEHSSALQAVVNFLGPVELELFYRETMRHNTIHNLMGGGPDEFPEKYLEAAPLHYVGAESPPVYSVYGELNQSLTPKHGELLDRRMKDAGVSHNLVIKLGEGWGVMPREGRGKLEDPVWSFLDSHLRK